MASTTSTGLGLEDPSEEQCRAELAAVLASDQFRRSPKLSRLLTYLCEKEFSGQASEITEYSIAIEALGRTEQFDPQQDAVVRVDTHHLRKKLKEYYAAAGIGRPIQIVIPNGQYAPQFAIASIVPIAPIAPPPPVEAITPVAPEPESAHRSWRWLVAGAAIVAAAGLGFAYLRHGAKPVPGVIPPGDELRIAVGDRSDDYIDSSGRQWLADRYFTGGTVFHHPEIPILRTHDPELFQNGREGQFVYAIPLRPGAYELHLYFAETGVASDTLRSVNLAVNGQPVSTFDVASDAGGINTATMKIFKDVTPASDGFLHLMFQGSGPNFLNAIEVLPGVRGKLLPIRIAAGEHAFRDHQGLLWLPDQWSLGGRKSSRLVPIDGTADPGLYQWERVGHFSYSIPVVEGELYTVTLHFSETWFTPPNSSGGVGSRVFDVYCNGTTLLKGFDILKEAGGVGHRAVIRSFHHVAASPLGKIDLDFVPVSNYALINAIEIVPE